MSRSVLICHNVTNLLGAIYRVSTSSVDILTPPFLWPRLTDPDILSPRECRESQDLFWCIIVIIGKWDLGTLG